MEGVLPIMLTGLSETNDFDLWSMFLNSLQADSFRKSNGRKGVQRVMFWGKKEQNIEVRVESRDGKQYGGW